MFTVECTIFVRVILVLGHAIVCDVLFCTTALPLGRFVQLMWLLVQPANAISPYMKYTVAKDFMMQCNWKEREATLVDLTQKVSSHIRHMRVVSAGNHWQRGSTPCCSTPPATVAAQLRMWTSRSSDDPVGTPQLAAGSPAVVHRSSWYESIFKFSRSGSGCLFSHSHHRRSPTTGTQADTFRVTKRSPWIYLSATGHPCSSLIFLSQCSQ